jgi:O-Antigen ligase
MLAPTTMRPPASSWMSVEAIRSGLVALIFVSSFYTLSNPAPCDLLFALALLMFMRSGLHLSAAIMPLMLLLMIYNFSGLVSYIVVPVGNEDARDYLIGLAYTSTAGLFLAAYIAEDPVARFLHVMKAWWIGGTIGAAIGLASYFSVPPFASVLPDFAGRVVGGYKDPNVFSTWLILPLVVMLQFFITGRLRIGFWSGVSFLLMFSALFLAFSRGAWINTLASVTLMIGMTYFLSPSRALRGRIVFSALSGAVLLAMVLAVLLSVPAVRELFLDRFTLVKNYDAGETGRFGNQLNSIPLLLERPFGFGPMQYREIFNLDPHNTFLNAFASNGWVGGIAYFLLVVSTMIAGLRAALACTPCQPFAIACLACFIATALQGVQIDMENWRHYYWLIGIIWGLYAASVAIAFSENATEGWRRVWQLPGQSGRV